MPDIVPTAPPPVNGPPVPGTLAPLAGPPLPSNLAPVQGPPAPVQAADVAPQVLGNTSQNPPVVPTPVGNADPMAVSKTAINDAQAAQADEQKAAKAEADAQQKKNEADAALADKQAEAIRKQQADQDAQQQASEQARGRLVALSQQADADVGNFKFHDFKDTIPTSRKTWLIIGAALSGLGGNSDPLAQINRLTAQHFEKEKAELSNKENLAKYRRDGVSDFDRHINDQRMLLEMKERNYREAMAKETEAQGMRSSNPVAAAKAQQLASKIRADGDAKLTGMVEQYTKGEEARARAAQLKAKAKGGGNGGTPEALGAFAAAAADLKPGAPITAKLAALGLKAGFKLKDVGQEVRKYQEQKGGGVDEKLVIHDVDGTPLGLSSGGRSVPQIQKDLRTIPRAIEQLKQLRESNDWKMTPGDPRFHNAVLAVASTTSAGSTDANVTHEKGSLTSAIGLPNNDAIDRKIAELENQLAETKAQMNPLPEGFTGGNNSAGKVGDVVGGDKLSEGPNDKQAATLAKLAKLGFSVVQ